MRKIRAGVIRSVKAEPHRSRAYLHDLRLLKEFGRSGVLVLERLDGNVDRASPLACICGYNRAKEKRSTMFSGQLDLKKDG